MRHTILFLAANPQNLDSRAIDAEANAIRVEIERSAHRERFNLVTRSAAHPLDLLRELRRLRPTIVHFSGHCAHPAHEGSPDEGSAREGMDAESQDGLFFLGPDGQAQHVTTEALGETFGAAGGSVKLVVLSACYSHMQATALTTHVDAAIGTVGSLRDDAAVSFAEGFYGGLAEGEPVATAFRQGCAATALYGLPYNERPRLEFRPATDASKLSLTTNFGLSQTAASAQRTQSAFVLDSSMPMTSQQLLLLCETEGLDTNRQAQWTQVGPFGVVSHGSRDPRIFYINHRQNIADLRRNSGPADLISRAIERGGDINNGQIVARIPLDVFSGLEWLRLIRHNAQPSA